jgi:cytochrome b561
MILKHHRIAVLVLALVVAALFASAASAQPIDAFGPTLQPAQPSRHVATSARSREVRVVNANAGSAFDWGDAGIGAGAAFAVTMIGLGGVLLVGARRRADQRAATS